MIRPLKVFRLPAYEAYYVRVFIWKDVETLREAIDCYVGATKKDYFGYYAGNTIHWKDGVILTKRIGDIHLHLENMGAGTFAHELQHFISDFVTSMGWSDDLTGEYWEPVSWISGEMTKRFWNLFYENFEQVSLPIRKRFVKASRLALRGLFWCSYSLYQHQRRKRKRAL